MPAHFNISALDGAARRGRLFTNRGTIDTPVFMPVGTLATVKTLRPEDVAALGYRLILANTYHLHLRPGEDVVGELGGVQKFMRWPHAMLTDSGGYQVFSLAAQRVVTEDGVTFQTENGEQRLTPESAMAIQATLGSDIAMAFDDVPAMDASPAVQQDSTARTHRWAVRCLASPKAAGQLRYGIAQGGANLALRCESAAFLGSLAFDGYGIGGLSLGESHAMTVELTQAVAERLPAERPRYLMGVGDPETIIEAVGAGVDQFDSVLPTRLGRHGAALTWSGRQNLKLAVNAGSGAPIEDGCGCPACSQFSRGWIRYLLLANEPVGMRLVTLHNLWFLSVLMERIRSAIAEGRYGSFAATALDRLRNRPA